MSGFRHSPASVTKVSADWRFCGKGSAIEGYCQQPSRMVNVWTGEWFSARCKSAKPSRCAWCAELHKGDVAAVGRSGWIDRPRDRGYWVALTAPGADRLPFDRSQCSHSGGVPCSGEIGCVVEADALAAWHDQLGANWTHFMTALRRLLNPGLSGPPSSWPVQVEFFKTFEPQKRGALHAHAMMRVTGPGTDLRFRAMFRLAARQNNFGSQVHCQQLDLADSSNAARKAGYCAKYASKCADELPAVRRIDVQTGEISYGGFRSWSSSRHWGATMKRVQQRRRTWAATGLGALRSGVPGVAVGGAAALDSYQEIYATASGFVIDPSVELSDSLV